MDNFFHRIVACGPRGTGSPGEAAAADLIERIFREAGLEVERQGFSVSAWPLILAERVLPLLAAAGMVLAGLLYANHPILAAVVLAAIAAAALPTGIRQRLGRKLFDLGRQIDSANIIGRSRPDRAGRLTLVFLAHYDSTSQTLPIILRLAAVLTAMAMCLVLFVLAVLSSTGIGPAGGAWVWSVVLVAVVALLACMFNRSGNRSPGATDNASGVAVLAALADELPERLTDSANLIFVATGAEELGLGGSMRFAQHHAGRLDPARTLCFNFDTLGSGKTIYLAGARKPFEDVPVVLSRLADGQGFKTRRLPVLIGVGMDHQQLRSGGLWAMSLTQGAGRAALHVHTAGDLPERVDTRRLAGIVRIVSDLAGEVVKNFNDPGRDEDE